MDMTLFLEIGLQFVLQKETILKTSETNELATCPGKKLQHLLNCTPRKILLSSLILPSSDFYTFV